MRGFGHFFLKNLLQPRRRNRRWGSRIMVIGDGVDQFPVVAKSTVDIVIIPRFLKHLPDGADRFHFIGNSDVFKLSLGFSVFQLPELLVAEFQRQGDAQHIGGTLNGIDGPYKTVAQWRHWIETRSGIFLETQNVRVGRRL